MNCDKAYKPLPHCASFLLQDWGGDGDRIDGVGVENDWDGMGTK